MADENERAQLGDQTETDPMVARPRQAAEPNDRAAGDEEIDDVRTVVRGSRISRKSRMKTASDNRSGVSSTGDSSEFDGQGGQMEGNDEQAKGTGYTNDRTGQQQGDGSLSGAKGKSGGQGSGTSDNERVGGQTAQNPRK